MVQPSDFEWFCPILDFSVWFFMILSTFEWFNQWRHLNTVWLNLFLGDIMQLQFMKSALTVNPCMVSGLSIKQCVPRFLMTEILIIAELAECSPIILQNGSSNLSSWKNLDLQPYDCTTVQGVTFNMHGQLYHRHTNATALSSSPVVSALGCESDNPGSSPGLG